MNNSIGSLAALAAFVAPAAVHADPAPPSDVRAASFTNVTLSYENTNHIDFDIDGDGTNDFYAYGNSSGGSSVFIGVYNATQYTSSSITVNSVFDTSQAATVGESLIFQPFNGYYGISFVSGFDSAVHAAWVHFDLSGSSPLLVGGAWQAEPLLSTITVGAIPEPSSIAALAGAGALLGACALRRRRLSSAVS